MMNNQWFTLRSLPRPIYKSTFIFRPNRFLVEIKIKNKNTTASLPNPGRLGEHMLPGVTLLVTPSKTEEAKHPYKVVGIQKQNQVIMLNTHGANEVAEILINNGLVPGFKTARVLRREVPVGNSRFDLLLRHRGKEVYCEVKSCTLFSSGLGMFPDAPSERASRHVAELARLSKKGIKTAIIFIIHAAGVTRFLPDYHTDLLFARTLYQTRKEVPIIPVAVTWDKNLRMQPVDQPVHIPWQIVEKEARDSGCYIVVIKLEKQKTITIGSLGPLRFTAGYYYYVGSAKKNLTQRIKRHQRLRKNFHWHIDYLRAHCTPVISYPIRTVEDLECDLAKSLRRIADRTVEGFGASDCHCGSHLFFMETHPKYSPPLQQLLLQYKIDRLQKEI